MNLFDRMKLPFRKSKEFLSALYDIMGFYPHDIEIYRIAFSHKSLSNGDAPRGGRPPRGGKGGNNRRRQADAPVKPLNNERLEYLGDAVLETVVSDILFHHFDRKREGFLTATRSKIVQREALNKLAAEMGLERLVQAAQGTHMSHTNIGGNAFEALMGAIYLDRGFKHCQWFIANRVIGRYVDLEGVAQKEVNFKSKLLEWSQKNRIRINFSDKPQRDDRKGFTTVITIEGLVLGRGEGRAKKDSQQQASREALTRMRQDNDLYDSIFRAKEKRTAMEAEESFALPRIDEIETSVNGKAKGGGKAAADAAPAKPRHHADPEAAYETAYDEDATFEVIDEAPAQPLRTAADYAERGIPAPPEENELDDTDELQGKRSGRDRNERKASADRTDRQPRKGAEAKERTRREAKESREPKGVKDNKEAKEPKAAVKPADEAPKAEERRSNRQGRSAKTETPVEEKAVKDNAAPVAPKEPKRSKAPKEPAVAKDTAAVREVAPAEVEQPVSVPSAEAEECQSSQAGRKENRRRRSRGNARSEEAAQPETAEVTETIVVEEVEPAPAASAPVASACTQTIIEEVVEEPATTEVMSLSHHDEVPTTVVTETVAQETLTAPNAAPAEEAPATPAADSVSLEAEDPATEAPATPAAPAPVEETSTVKQTEAAEPTDAANAVEDTDAAEAPQGGAVAEKADSIEGPAVPSEADQSAVAPKAPVEEAPARSETPRKAKRNREANRPISLEAFLLGTEDPSESSDEEEAPSEDVAAESDEKPVSTEAKPAAPAEPEAPAELAGDASEEEASAAPDADIPEAEPEAASGTEPEAAAEEPAAEVPAADESAAVPASEEVAVEEAPVDDAAAETADEAAETAEDAQQGGRPKRRRSHRSRRRGPRKGSDGQAAPDAGPTAGE